MKWRPVVTSPPPPSGTPVLLTVDNGVIRWVEEASYNGSHFEDDNCNNITHVETIAWAYFPEPYESDV